MTRIIIIILLILVAALGGYIWYQNGGKLFPLTSVLPSTSNSPQVSVSPGGTTNPNANIIVTSPTANQTVTNPIIVKGRARVFENTFNFRLTNTQGTKLYEGYGTANAPDIGQYGDFEVKIPVPANAPKNLVVEVFDYSAKDGSVENLVKIPVTLEAQTTMQLKAYFINSKLDPQNSCTKVFSVSRTVLKTQEVGYISLIELLKGPSSADKLLGYSTSLPENVRINSIEIRDGIAFVDFDETLQNGVAGSCRVTAIRSQITETLKQFTTVRDVMISINGRTNDILQP